MPESDVKDVKHEKNILNKYCQDAMENNAFLFYMKLSMSKNYLDYCKRSPKSLSIKKNTKINHKVQIQYPLQEKKLEAGID